jgi:hypothetical protein
MVHSLLYLSYLTHSIDAEVHPTLHHSQDGSELQELLLLCRNQRMSFEEGHDSLNKMLSIPHVKDEKVFSVIIVSAIAVDLSATKVVLENLERFYAPFALHYCESGLALPP